MKNIEALDCFLNIEGNRIPAGRLVLSRGKVAWKYDPEIIHAGLQLSPLAQPLNSETQLLEQSVTANSKHGLPGFIADALPDHWGNKILEAELQAQGLQVINPLDRLAWQGKRAIGALEFEPTHGLPNDETNAWTFRQLKDQAAGVMEGRIDQLHSAINKAGGTAGGAYPKVAALLNADNEVMLGIGQCPLGYRPVILKIPTQNSQYARVEHSYAEMAREAGINVPKTTLIEREGLAWFAIDRFDRLGDGFTLKRHQITLAGLLDREFDRQATTAEEALAACKQTTLQHADSVELFRRIVFNYLGHNCDDHAKNFSFQMDGKGEWRLSPWYDGGWCLNTGGHAMSIDSWQIAGPKERYLRLAKRAGIRNAEGVIGEVSAALALWPKIAKRNGISTEKVNQIQQSITANLLLLG